MTQSMKSLPVSNEIFDEMDSMENEIAAMENEILNEIHTDEQ
jgi:hypothetical protein